MQQPGGQTPPPWPGQPMQQQQPVQQQAAPTGQTLQPQQQQQAVAAGQHAFRPQVAGWPPQYNNLMASQLNPALLAQIQQQWFAAAQGRPPQAGFPGGPSNVAMQQAMIQAQQAAAAAMAKAKQSQQQQQQQARPPAPPKPVKAALKIEDDGPASKKRKQDEDDDVKLVAPPAVPAQHMTAQQQQHAFHTLMLQQRNAQQAAAAAAAAGFRPGTPQTALPTAAAGGAPAPSRPPAPSGMIWPPPGPPGGTQPAGPRIDPTSMTPAMMKALREDAQRLLPRRGLHHVLKAAGLEGTVRLDPALEAALTEMYDELLGNAIVIGCGLAKRRKTTQLRARDLALPIEQNWHVNVPGFAGDSLRPYRRLAGSELHKARAVAVRRTAASLEEAAGKLGDGAVPGRGDA